MQAIYHCEKCGFLKNVSPKMIGKSAKCPNCGHSAKIKKANTAKSAKTLQQNPLDAIHDQAGMVQNAASPVSKISFKKKFGALVLGGIALLYIANPTAGIIEFLPDNTPLLGNLDEGGAIILLLNCLRCFGFDLTGKLAG